MSEYKLAIFDQTIDHHDTNLHQPDFWRAVIDSRQNTVVAQGVTLHSAIGSLLLARQHEELIPDVIFVGDHLQDDHRYVDQPTRCPVTPKLGLQPVKRKLWRSNPNDYQAESLVFLPSATSRGPNTLQRNDIELPILRERHRRSDLERIQQDFRDTLQHTEARSTPAIFVVAFTTRLLFPEHPITLVGVSDSDISTVIPVNKRVKRTIPEAGRLRRELAQLQQA